MGMLVLVLLIISSSANAALHGRLPATPGGTDYQAYYDDHLNITWLADANLASSNTFGLPVGEWLGPHQDDPLSQYDGASNGLIRRNNLQPMNYAGALHWLDAMNAANYLGYSGWQLPTTLQGDTSCSYVAHLRDAIDLSVWHDVYIGENCTGGNLGHLFYNEGVASWARAPFLNVISTHYWTRTDAEFNELFSYDFHMGTGDQNFGGKQSIKQVWPVLSGDVITSSPPDFDLDGIPDAAELNGIDVDGDGILEFNLSELGADPCRKTIVVEIDYMDGSITGFSHEPHPDLIPFVAAAFDAAPIPAPPDCPFEGFPSQANGVNFIALVDEQVPEQVGKFSTSPELDAVRQTYFNEDLLPWLHYALFVHELKAGGKTSGVCCNEGSFLVSLGNWTADSTTNPGTNVPLYDPDADQSIRLRLEAGTFMHELGHALGLPHGGNDRINFKPNYLSIMNYTFQTSLLTSEDNPAMLILDYSREVLPILDERELFEDQPLCDHPACQPLLTAWKDPAGKWRNGAITGPLNWNRIDGIESESVEVDINGRNKGECVGDGPDDIMDTTPGDDDVVSLPYITSGPNGICETSVADSSDDSQLAKPGTEPDIVHTGNDDWSAIKFLAAENAYGAGVPLLVSSDIEELTAEEADEIDAFWSQVREELLAENPNQPPTANPQSVTLNEDTPTAVTLTGNDADDFPETPLVYEIVSGPGNGALSGTAPNLIYAPDQHFFGTDSFTFRTFDGELYSATVMVDITIDPVNDAPLISIDRASASLQYSDTIGMVTITATDVDDHPLELTSNWTMDGGAANAGLPSMLGTSGSCTPDTDIGTSCSWTFNGQMLAASGDYDIRFTVTDGGGSTTTVLDASESTELNVATEDASIAFDDGNPVAIQIVMDGGNSDSFYLAVDITESLPDIFAFTALPGDIGNAAVSMTLSPIGPGQSAIGTCVTTSVDPVSDAYTQAKTVVCTFNDVSVNTYSAIVTVNGRFYMGTADDVLTVYDPSLGFTTGGGWFYWPGTTDKTNFGYTMKYNKQGNKVKGSLLLIRHLADKSGKYRIKSNTLEGLALGEDSTVPKGWATFSGKNTYIEPGWENAEGNYKFTVYVEDHDEPGAGIDRFWIKARDKNNSVIDIMSMPEPGIDNATVIDGGNIFVPH